MKTKGIILAGGSGSRLYPTTAVFSKQLQPVYDKPLIYYPLATLLLAGIREILIISTPRDTPYFEQLLGDGSQWGISLEYIIQSEPKGLAEAFIYGKDFIGQDQVCLILGDNVFYGKLDFLRKAIAENTGGTIFGYHVQDPERYGVVEFGAHGEVLSIEEKPLKPKSNYAIPGLYIFTHDVTEIAPKVQPSARGEVEITEIHNAYLRNNQLRVELMGRGIAWLDTGTPESLLEASTFIHAIEKRQGTKIACLEEIALQMKYITREKYLETVNNLPKSSYRDYCVRVLDEIERESF
ncbi:MAG: glucose-1-phosphate thymidylyltransferase RfbA [Ignavibacteria bacterium]|nr:glucose-1-phosphate thymidylyltransferase RfbA [Ignavibacteria bacterium]